MYDGGQRDQLGSSNEQGSSSETPGRDDNRVLYYMAMKGIRESQPAVEIRGARFVPKESVEELPKSALVIRAINSGDMYHLRAAFTLAFHDKKAFPDGPRVLIWGVSEKSQRQAQEMASLLADPEHVFYTDEPSLHGFNHTETWCTDYIEKRMLGGLPQEPKKKTSSNDDDEKEKDEGHEHDESPSTSKGKVELEGKSLRALEMEKRMQRLAAEFAPYDEHEAKEFEQDLAKYGQIKTGSGPYVIVNFRATGHSDRPGANAPALDTGTVGMQQLIVAIGEQLPGATIVPMGEESGGLTGPNLLNYWSWPSVKGSRLKQAALMRYLNNACSVVGVVGMRSGVIDQLVFCGLRVISIDISPHKGLKDGQAPDLSTPKGWDRGMKLERAFGANYGHVYIEHARDDETKRNVSGWEGEFDPRDVATIGTGIGAFWGKGTEDRRRDSQPMNPDNLDDAYYHVSSQLAQPRSAYELLDNYSPYLNHIGDKRKSDTRWSELQQVVRDAIAGAEHGEPRTVDWMAQHQYGSLLAGEESAQFYSKQTAQIQQDEKFQAKDDPVDAYRKLDKKYRTPTIKAMKIKLD